jgi:AcrR family transcriptional regulator
VEQPKRGRQKAVGDLKRTIILDAAREIFETEGLEGASLRAIATRAGYTPQALYFHFDSKEALYAQVLQDSLSSLALFVERCAQVETEPTARLRAAAMGFFDFYAQNPRDLDLGFYLLRGGMKPAGLGADRDVRLNAGLEAALAPIADAAQELGYDAARANLLVTDIFAHATGLLLLLHTGRIRMFGASAEDRMRAYIENCIVLLPGHALG